MKKLLITLMTTLALTGCSLNNKPADEVQPTDQPVIESTESSTTVETTKPAETEQPVETESSETEVELTALGQFMTDIQGKEEFMVPMSLNLTKEEFCVSYGVDEKLVNDVFASKAAISAQMSDLIAIELSDESKGSDVLSAIESYYDSQRLYPTHMEYVDSKVVIDRDGYLFVIVAEKAEEIGEYIETSWFVAK